MIDISSELNLKKAQEIRIVVSDYMNPSTEVMLSYENIELI